MSSCADCGTRLRSYGACPNCHEELVIEREQAQYMEGPYSPEWDRKVADQSRAVSTNRHSNPDDEWTRRGREWPDESGDRMEAGIGHLYGGLR
mgnify:CR=1 FL=1